MISGLMHVTQKVWKKGMTKLKQRGKAAKILLLPLLRRKLKSVISDGNCKLRIFFLLKILIVVFWLFLVSKKIWGKWIYACKACCIIKTKTRSIIFNNAACLGLIMLRVSIMLRVDLARLRLPLIISLPPKKTAPVFLTQLVCVIFLSAFGDIMQTENYGFG